MKNIARAATLFLLLSAGCNGCGAWAPPATCAPCGDGSIVCTGTVMACAEDGTDGCQTLIGATGAASLVLRVDGSYVEASIAGTQAGTWNEEVVGAGEAILLHTSAGPTALLSVYPVGACSY